MDVPSRWRKKISPSGPNRGDPPSTFGICTGDELRSSRATRSRGFPSASVVHKHNMLTISGDVVVEDGKAAYPRWIGNGKSLLILDRCVPDGPRGIVVFSLETGEKRCLTAPPLYSEPGGSLPVLSPDGRTVAFNRSSTVNQSELYTVALSGGNLRQMTKNGTDCVGTPMWSSDGQYITFNSSRIGLTRVVRQTAQLRRRRYTQQ